VANDIRYIRGEGLWNSEKLLYHCSLDSHQILHLQINVREYRKEKTNELVLGIYIECDQMEQHLHLLT
jgi:hypothetical protein